MWPSNLRRPPEPAECGGQPHDGEVGRDTKIAVVVVAGSLPRPPETPKMPNNDPGHGSTCFHIGDTSVDYNASTAELDLTGEPDAAEAVCAEFKEGLKTAQDPVSREELKEMLEDLMEMMEMMRRRPGAEGKCRERSC